MFDGAVDLTRRLPTHEEALMAGDAATVMAEALVRKEPVAIGDPKKGTMPLPPAISDLLIVILEHIAKGEMITFVPVGAMLSTQEAADLLNVSRPYLSGLLKKGEIPFIPVGSHRRIRFEDLMKYKDKRDNHRLAGLEELARLGQEFDAL